ncbi:hypothetical protein AHAS_Ahas20G0124600 [Arachis hypogaea]
MGLLGPSILLQPAILYRGAGIGLSLTIRTYKEIQVGWTPPKEGWIQLNVDGSVYQPGSRRARGGVLRDPNGEFIVEFCMNIGCCSITTAKTLGDVSWDQACS